MAAPRTLVYLAVSIATATAGARAHAESVGPLLALEASAGAPLSAPQSERFGVGAAGALAGYYPVASFLLLGAKLRAGFLSDGDPPANPGERDPGQGTFQTLTALLRVRPLAGTEQRSALGPFVEAGPSGVLTGELLRAGLEAGVGWGFELGAIALAPSLRYLQVVQPSDPLSDADARVLLFGAELALVSGRSARTATHVPAPAPAARPAPGDRDADGLPDDRDACAELAEDRDGYSDEDGCPESDNDRDELPDASDSCPNDPEDVDAFEDQDGCPELDNDRDALLDADDQCPLEAEVVNGNQDDDGCPDEGVIELRNDRIVLEEQVLFDFERARVRTAARDVLDAIVRLYRQHPEWMQIRIEGHADARGNPAFNQELSERRAENVRKTLIELGIPAAMIESAGYGAAHPRDMRATEDGYRRNRRVEFVVVARSAAQAVPAASAPATPEPSAPDPDAPAAAPPPRGQP